MAEEVVVATKGEEAREAKSGERGVGVTREVSVIGVAKELAEDWDGPFPARLTIILLPTKARPSHSRPNS